MVPEVDARLRITLYLIRENLGVRATAARDPTSLVVLDGVATDEGCGVEHHDSIGVVGDFVADDPCKATLDNEDAFGSALANLVPDHDSVRTGRPTEG